jgi:hypothetical protein
MFSRRQHKRYSITKERRVRKYHYTSDWNVISCEESSDPWWKLLLFIFAQKSLFSCIYIQCIRFWRIHAFCTYVLGLLQNTYPRYPFLTDTSFSQLLQATFCVSVFNGYLAIVSPLPAVACDKLSSHALSCPFLTDTCTRYPFLTDTFFSLLP